MAALTSDTLPSTCFARVAQHDLFADLDAETVDALSGELTTEHLAAGTVLFRQGDVGDSMFFITKGRLGVRITSSAAAESVVDELLPGVTVGEMSLMTGQPRAPSLFGSMMRTVEINEAYRMKSPAFLRVADLLIHLPLEQFRTLDFDSYAAIIERGYQATQQIISTHTAQLERMIIADEAM